MKTLPKLVVRVVLTFGILFVAWYAFSIWTMTIRYEPACLVFRSSEDDKGKDLNLKLRVIFTKFGLSTISESEKYAEFESDGLLIVWSKDKGYWLSVCSKSEDHKRWDALLKDVQAAILQSHSTPVAYLHPGEARPGPCKPKGGPVNFSVDVNEIEKTLTCLR